MSKILKGISTFGLSEYAKTQIENWLNEQSQDYYYNLIITEHENTLKLEVIKTDKKFTCMK